MGDKLLKKILFTMITCIIFALTFTNVCMAFSMSAEEFCKAGKAAYLKLDYDEALKDFNSAIKADESYIEGYQDKGDLLCKMEKYEDALDTYQAALSYEDSKNDTLLLCSIGNTLYSLDRLHEASAFYDRALDINSTYLIAAIGKGDVCMELEKYNDAVTWYQKSINISPQTVALYNRLGKAYFYTKQYGQALESFEKVLDYNPNDLSALVNKGCALNELGRYNEAITCFDKGLALDKDNANACYHMSRSQALIGNKENAIEYLKKAISIDKQSAVYASDDDAFKSLSSNMEFIKLTGEATDALKDMFENSDVLKSGDLSDVKYYYAKTTGNSQEDNALLEAVKKYIDNKFKGNIYDSESAKNCGVYMKSPLLNLMIDANKQFKKYTLLGITTNYNIDKCVIVLTGYSNDKIKTGVIKVTGNYENTEDEASYSYILVFINENGSWQYFGNVALIDSDK